MLHRQPQSTTRRVSTLAALAAVVISAVASVAGCREAERLDAAAGPGPVPVEQWNEAVRVTGAMWDGNRTLTLTLEGDLSKASDLAPIVAWGYVKNNMPVGGMPDMPLPSGRRLKVGGLMDIGLEVTDDASLLDRVSEVQHHVSFIPFCLAGDASKGGLLELVATTLRDTWQPQTFALALPVYRARNRMDWFKAPAQDLRPMFIILAPSPYKGAKLPSNWRLGVEDLPPDEPAAKPPAKKGP